MSWRSTKPKWLIIPLALRIFVLLFLLHVLPPRPKLPSRQKAKNCKVLRRHHSDLEINVRMISSKITAVMPGSSMDCCLLEQCNRQIAGFEREMLDIHVFCTIATMEDTSELNIEKIQISNVFFNLGLKINKFLSYPKEATIKPVREGIRLPKIAVPTFDGDPLKWMNFWKQFEISINSKKQLICA